MYKNIFVLNTGRCGSTTFSQACRHFNNYTSGHETRSRFIGDIRFSYPAHHIEADNRLSWLLGRLERTYGDDAFYVHLERDAESTARSYAKRKGGIMAAYRGSGIIMGCRETDPFAIAMDYVDTVTENIRFFLKNKSNKVNFRLENAESDFLQFTTMVGAKGNLDRALAEFDVKHNASLINA